jgi:antitoxin component YwqK of YwqJK toxin-antitoxin module
MRFLSTLIILLIVNYCLAQDTLDTVRNGDIALLYKKGQLQEKWYYVNDQVDIKVIYVYREGVLVRREWWRAGKRLSYTLE